MDAVLNSPIFWALIRIIIVVGFLLAIVPGLIWWERRLLSWMQDRVGPNRVGPAGLLQPIADGIKLFFKEEVRPFSIDPLIFWLAPALALFPAFVSAATIPWGPTIPVLNDVPSSYLTPIANVNIGVLWLLAFTGLGVYGVVLAGWASNNKYSLLGALRSGAQLISYELSMGLALGIVILTAGSLEIPKIIESQSGPLWNIPALEFVRNWAIFNPIGFVAFFIFLVCMVAETNRAPFDLPEAESELIAGFHTEYSSMKFAVFFMGEYASMLTIAALSIVMFLGGYTLPINFGAIYQPLAFLDGPYLGPLWFLLKLTVVFSFYIWLRATLPRLRYDQLMNLGWKGLLPTTLILLFLTLTNLTFGPYIAAIPGVLVLVIYAVRASQLKAEQKKLARKVTLHKQSVPLS